MRFSREFNPATIHELLLVHELAQRHQVSQYDRALDAFVAAGNRRAIGIVWHAVGRVRDFECDGLRASRRVRAGGSATPTVAGLIATISACLCPATLDSSRAAARRRDPDSGARRSVRERIPMRGLPRATTSIGRNCLSALSSASSTVPSSPRTDAGSAAIAKLRPESAQRR